MVAVVRVVRAIVLSNNDETVAEFRVERDVSRLTRNARHLTAAPH